MKSHVFRSLPVSADSRTLRNLDIFPDSESQSYTWEREGKSSAQTHPFPLIKGGGRLRGAVKYLLFMLWVPYVLVTRGRRDDVAIFMDLETALFGIPVAKLMGIKAVFDIVDPFAQTKVRGASLQKLVDRVEVAVAERAELVVVPHACRMDYYQSRLHYLPKIKSLLVIENVPSFGGGPSAGLKIRARSPHKTVLGYFGSLDRDKRGLEWLLSFVQRYPAQYELIVAGQGALAGELAQAAAAHDNIRFYGPYHHADLIPLYEAIDFTWAYYSASVSLHRFAAPNKFYEHLFFGKPIITSTIIPQWQTIERLGTGASVDCESVDPAEWDRLHARLQLFQPCRRSEIRSATQKFWDENYHDYYRKSVRLFHCACAR